MIERYHETVPFTEGWRQGAVMRTPTHTQRGPFDEPPASDGGPVPFVPTPEPPKHLQYIVLLGDADWKDARVTKIWPGSNEIMREFIGHDLGL